MYQIALSGLGNIGRYAIEALEIMPDCQCTGIIRRQSSIGSNKNDLRGIDEFTSIDELIAKKGKPDCVLLCLPSRQVPITATEFLSKGINTVDSFDIHDRIVEIVNTLEETGKKFKAVSITAAGWDPGTDSVLRALFEAMVPIGTTFTNFGRGRSMGHSVAARSIEGIADATSITIPMGGGRHSRLVYVVLESNANLETVKEKLKADPYFAHDPLEVKAITKEQMPFVADQSHGVLMERLGASGHTSNQKLNFDMRIDNPALTAQVMASCARATIRFQQNQQYGAFTMIDIPPIYLLPGSRKENLARLV